MLDELRSRGVSLGIVTNGWVEAQNCWFVGNSPRNDVWGPQQVGMKAAFLRTGHALGGEKPEAALRDLRDVLNLL